MKNFQREGRTGGWKGPKKFGGPSAWKRNTGSRFTERTLHRATCTECGDECQVPFKPDGTKPVLCRNCFKTDSNPEPRRFGGERSGGSSFREKRPYEKRPYSGGSDRFESKGSDQYKDQFKIVNAKLDSILKALNGDAAVSAPVAPVKPVAPEMPLPKVADVAVEVSEFNLE